jgi:DNA (cytosine-5)-methyltransferase 1
VIHPQHCHPTIMTQLKMRYLSVFSGIEAASVAWKDLAGWEAQGFSEIDPFASAVLAHHYPQIKNYGDITKHPTWGIKPGSIDLLIGGSPCQAFSIGGYREGLADPRGNLTLTFVSLIANLRPRWVLWENVGGVLSSNGGRDFKCFLYALAQCGYWFAWRVLDAQSTGSPWPVPQRRKRVYLVAHSLGWEAPAKVLFKSQGLPGNSNQSQPEGETAATTVEDSIGKTGTGLTHFRKASRAQSSTDSETWVQSDIFNTLNLFDVGDVRTTELVVNDEAVLYENHGQDSRITECRDVAPTVCAKYGTGGGNTPLVREVISFQPGNLARNAGSNPSSKFVTTLKASAGDQTPHIADIHCVRRLHPIEAERLQGFPDNWTQIPWRGKPIEKCPEAQRFKCIGNSMAVPVIRLLGERINAIEQGKL